MQLLDYPLEESKFDHRFVGDNHHFIDVFHFLQVLHRIAFEINFGRYFEPLHIVSPAAYFLDIQQIDGADIVAHGIAPIRAATQGKRGQESVVHIADTAKSRRRIPDNADGPDRLAELFDQFGVFAVNGSGMAKAVEFHHLPRFIDTVFRIFRFEYGNDR